jgi:hypothetical protein
MDVLILSLVVLTVSLVIAGYLMARAKTLLGVILGALPIPLMVLLTRWSIQSSIERCLAEACAASKLSEECNFAQLGCTEWPSRSLALLNFSGVAVFVLYLLGVLLIAVVRSRKN